MNVHGEADTTAAQRLGRVDAVDCARGLALIGMAIYHLSWDLADFRLGPPILPFTPQMRLLSHIVASAFLALVGVSLALAHRNRLNLPAFWRRLAEPFSQSLPAIAAPRAGSANPAWCTVRSRRASSSSAGA